MTSRMIQMGADSPPASPRGFWMHTYFEMQGQYLVAKCYLVAMDTPVFFEMKLDTAPLLNAVRRGHDYLHGHGTLDMGQSPEQHGVSGQVDWDSGPSLMSQVQGEGIPVNLVGGEGIPVNLVGSDGIPLNLVGAQTTLVQHVAQQAQAIAQLKAAQSAQQSPPTPAHAAMASANALLAAIEKKDMGHGTWVSGSSPKSQVQRRIAHQVVGSILRAGATGKTGAAMQSASVLRMTHAYRDYLKALGRHGKSSGMVIDEQGNIVRQETVPVPTVQQAIPQLAAAVSGHATIVGGHATIVGGHATIVGSDCIGCGCIGCY